MYIEYLRRLCQVVVGLLQRSGHLRELVCGALVEHGFAYMEDSLQFLPGHQGPEILLEMVHEKYDFPGFADMGLQPFAVAAGIVILRKRVLQGSDVKYCRNISFLQPVEDMFQVVCDLPAMIDKTVPAVCPNRVEYKDMRLIQDKAEIL